MQLLKNAISYEVLAKALFENYESIYVISAENSDYICFHESSAYRELQLTSEGEDFFAANARAASRVIYSEDQDYVLRKMSRAAVLAGLKKSKYYGFIYRISVGGEPVYHQIRATLETIEGRECIILGVRNVDTMVRHEQKHVAELESMLQKEKNHMEAVLATAAAYMEINLSRDLVLECSPGLCTGADMPESLRYTDFHLHWCAHMVTAGLEKYREVGSREYLIRCFGRGEMRVSVPFSARTPRQTAPQPCRQVYYLYRDNTSGDVLCFAVLYDLTEQQRREKELEELEQALRMSRLRNFTSQMQPHFLYNALGSIQEIILEDPAYASELLGDFTIHLRSCIRTMASDEPLPFPQELENIRAYVNIEKMRFGAKLRVEYDVAVTDFAILPLSIQPLVENAIRHGVYARGMRGGTVKLRTRETDAAWLVQIEDDGVGFDVAAFRAEMARGTRDSTGLENLTFRLEKVMGAAVDVQSTVGVGTTVTVTIPKGGSGK